MQVRHVIKAQAHLVVSPRTLLFREMRTLHDYFQIKRYPCNAFPSEILAMIGEVVYSSSFDNDLNDSDWDSEADESELTRLERIKLVSLINWKFRSAVLPILLRNAKIVIKDADALTSLRRSSKRFMRLINMIEIRDTGCMLFSLFGRRKSYS